MSETAHKNVEQARALLLTADNDLRKANGEEPTTDEDLVVSEALEAPGAPDLGQRIETNDGYIHVRALPTTGPLTEKLIAGFCAARTHLSDDRVPRSGYNKFLKQYHATHDDISYAVGPALAKGAIWAIPSTVEVLHVPCTVKVKDHRTGGEVDKPSIRCTVLLEVAWSAGDGTYRTYWVGTSIDGTGSDKHEYQVYSQTLKYALAKTLWVATGDADVDQANPAGQDRPAPDAPPSGEQAAELVSLKKRAAELGCDVSEVKPQATARDAARLAVRLKKMIEHAEQEAAAGEGEAEQEASA